MGLSFKEFEQQGWEKVADAYHEGFGLITTQAASALVQSAMIQPGDRVLDIACGPGYVAALVADKSAQVIGIDFSNAMIQKAKLLHPKIPFQIMDAEELHFSNGMFNAVLMNFGMLHLDRPEQAIAEAFRVLKPGGRFLFTVWDEPVRSKAFELIMSVLKEDGDINIPLPKGPDFFKFSDPNISQTVLLNTGFKKVEVNRIEFIWTLQNSEELFQTFYQGGIRIGGMLRAQKPEAICNMIKHLEQKTKVFQVEGKLKIPTSVMLYQAKKI